MASPVDLDAALKEFTKRVSELSIAGPTRIPIETLRDKKSTTYGEWAHASGVYFFEQGDTVQYIGRALPGTGLRARVHNQCTSYGDEEWDRIIKNDTLPTTVGVVYLPEEEWYWAAALEAFLIAKCHPPYNKRSS